MKKLILYFFISVGLNAQFNYQAIIKDSDGNPVTNNQIKFKFPLMYQSSSTTTIFVEEHDITTPADGVVNLSVGGGTVVNGTFSSIDWSQSIFMKEELDTTNGYQIMETKQVASDPVAEYAKNDGNLFYNISNSQSPTSIIEITSVVPQEEMERIFNEIKTPFKYGVVVQHPDSGKMVDSPTIFRENDIWYMTYIVFDGQGYETWLSQSDNLLNWETKGKILSFSENTWDANQKAGYISLISTDWGGDYSVENYQDKYWMTYLGGNTEGYEKGTLKIGLANSPTLTEADEWNRNNSSILSPEDEDVRWFENKTIYKSLVIRDSIKHTGHPFVMYYNAKGDTANYESIAMAVSDDMIEWKRYGENPLITKGKGICGDAQVVKFGDIYIMFYFGAFWKPGAFERFACSYDLINWTDWNGEDLIASSEDYDKKYAHKPWVLKWNGIVYHFYNAVGDRGRVIALSTSKDLTK